MIKLITAALFWTVTGCKFETNSPIIDSPKAEENGEKEIIGKIPKNARQPNQLSTEQKSLALTGDPGALIDIKMASRVGVLLDEYPAGTRTRVKNRYLNAPAQFWEERAASQVEATLYRLTYRQFFYSNKG